MGTSGANDPRPQRAVVESRLRTLGIGVSTTPAGGRPDLALDETITPETFAASGGAAAGARPPDAEPSVGPLPRIALSGEVTPGPPAAAGPSGADLELVAVLGEGGMGRVHLARQRSLGREVAVKTLKDEVADPRTVAMLRAEATTMGRLEHPNVVPVHAVGVDDGGRLLLVMKRIDGVSWRELLRDPAHPRWAALAPDPAARLDLHLDVLVQVANALHFAHESGVVHRDVKPDNVLLGAHGEVYLADWGVALRVGDAAGGTELVGTPAYMAPEMVVGDRARIDRRTDVFLLGATLHEVLTGAPPHQGPTLHATLIAAFEAQPPAYAPDVPAELAAIAARAMAPDPEARFPTTLALRHAIEETRRHRGSIALTRTGRALLEALRPLLAREGRDSMEPGLDRRLTECRFALVSALRDWPENRDAALTLDECLRLSIEHELVRENAGAARGLHAELSSPDPALEKRIDELAARVEARRAEADRMRRLEADQDIAVGFRARAVSLGILVLVAGTLTIAVLTVGDGRADDLRPIDTVYLSLGVLSAVLVPMALFRRWLWANAMGRRISALLVLVTGGLVAHRAMGAAFDVPAPAILAMDLVVLTMLTAASGMLVPRTALAALVPAAGAAVAHFFPHHMPAVFSIATLLNLVAVLALWLVELRAGRTHTAGTTASPR